ncbi:flavodoxin family protein [uncultured Desulfobacter sp.]|uniref:flavodoxin family protein n=1 Tax=uncultured Desulfobacter sp. TaxID=240139 RepID=UPI002AAABBDB|nr:flavodoxin family protein [uncultured Desulfobacter sp.]
MNVLLLQGGAKKNGNTAQVLEWVTQELIRLGHDVETINLHSKNLKGCMGCAQCKPILDAPGCIQRDDMTEILEKIVKSQAVIFSSPLYFWGVNAQLKSVIDRTYSLYATVPEHTSLVEGQRQGLLMTGGGPFENNAAEAFTAFGRMQKYHKSVKAAELFVGGCSTPDKLADSVKDQAYEFARKLTGQN